jgi:sugar O-acyltransferase (sialic acid O-acetyltransferase NeuD family)
VNRLFIVGAGGFGRETLGWALAVPAHARDWEVAGFLDANPRALEGLGCAYSILGDPATYLPAETDRFVCAIGHPSTKLRVVAGLESRGARFESVIHPTAVIGAQCEVGAGCILCPGVVLSHRVVLGKHVALNLHATVGHDAVIGDGCTLSCHADVTGGAVLGRGVLLGSHATVLPGAKVGDFAVVGAGSVAVGKVRPHVTVFGVPARELAFGQRGER